MGCAESPEAFIDLWGERLGFKLGQADFDERWKAEGKGCVNKSSRQIKLSRKLSGQYLRLCRQISRTHANETMHQHLIETDRG